MVLTPAPVVFHANFAVVPAVAAAGCDVTFTVTATLAAGCSTYAAAGAAASAQAVAAITSDRASALVDRVAAGRPRWVNAHLERVGGAARLSPHIGCICKKT